MVKLSNIIKSDEGNAFTVLLIFMIVALVLAAIIPLEGLRTVNGADITLKEGVAESCRAAAMCLHQKASVENVFVVDPIRAHRKFRSMLAANLEVGTTLQPGSSSGFTGDIEYELVVVNPENDFAESMVFSSSNPGGQTIPCPSFPVTFTVGEDGVRSYGDGVEVTLTKPGCVAVVTAGIRPVLKQDANIVFRWAAAELADVPQPEEEPPGP